MAEEKIRLEICCGTTCYMLGAAELLEFENALPEHWKPRVEVSVRPCLDACTRQDLGQAPFVRLDGELIGNATPEKVFQLLEQAIAKRESSK